MRPDLFNGGRNMDRPSVCHIMDGGPSPTVECTTHVRGQVRRSPPSSIDTCNCTVLVCIWWYCEQCNLDSWVSLRPTRLKYFFPSSPPSGPWGVSGSRWWHHKNHPTVFCAACVFFHPSFHSHTCPSAAQSTAYVWRTRRSHWVCSRHYSALRQPTHGWGPFELGDVCLPPKPRAVLPCGG